MTVSAPPSPFPEERRLATVLFADVQGFTHLAERLDDETVSDLVKGIWSRLDAVITQHGGYIDKHMGDAVMAVWGAPTAGDDDAERAVSAALAMQAALDEYVQTLKLTDARQLKLRIGVNSGAVFAGYIGSRNEYTVIGDTVNVAARFEQCAEAGTVIIGENTLRLLRGAFRVRRIAPLEVKGKTEPVVAFVVEGRPMASGRVRYGSLDSLITVMVGREAEIERLENLYRLAMEANQPLLVIVTGEAGLGKSRLIMEFTHKLELETPNSLLLSGRALAQTSQVPFYLWKALWYAYGGLQDADEAAVRNDKFLQAIQKLWNLQPSQTTSSEVAHLVGSLIGLEWRGSPYLAAYSAPEVRLNRAFALMRELLQRLASKGSLVMALDDLQWADRNSLELLYYLCQPAETRLPLLILAGARPEFLRQQPRWSNLAQIITLKLLQLDAARVAEAYPHLRNLAEACRAELAARAEGNPYFLEEMVKSLPMAGGSEAAGDTDALLNHLSSQMPESLRSMLQARLDALSREARSVALLASVVGRVFWVGAIVAAARATTGFGTGPLVAAPSSVVERLIQNGLRQLVHAELAFPRAGSSFSPEQEYIFKNSLLRDVAYSLIPNKNRAAYHLAVAHWLSAHEASDFKLMAAEHYEQAGARFEAARQYETAIRQALARGAVSEADLIRTRLSSLRATFP